MTSNEKELFLPANTVFKKLNALGLVIAYDSEKVVVKVILEGLKVHVETFKNLTISKYSNDKEHFLLFEDTNNKKKKFKLNLDKNLSKDYLERYVLNIMK